MKAQIYNGILTAFFWIVQLSDFWRVLWFFGALMQDGQLATWLMTIVVELGMGLLSLDLLRRITANNARTWRVMPDDSRKQIGAVQPTALLWLSVSVLGVLETFISVSYFYEFGRVTRLTERLLGGDTLWTAFVFGAMSTVLTLIFSGVEGERTRIAVAEEEREQEREKARTEREQKRKEAEAQRAAAERERLAAERQREQERVVAENLRYVCDRCGQRFADQRAFAGHRRWCSGDGSDPERAADVAQGQDVRPATGQSWMNCENMAEERPPSKLAISLA